MGQAVHVSEVNPNTCGRSGARNVWAVHSVRETRGSDIRQDIDLANGHECLGHPDDYFSK
jgi:hypothetical protein